MIFPRTVGDYPLNIKLGTQRVRVGKIIRRPDGTIILVPRIPHTGLHASLHPTLVKVSDNLGFDQRFDLLPLVDEREFAMHAVEFYETLLAGLEVSPEFDEDLMGFSDPEARFARLARRSRHGIDLDILGALRSQGGGLPFFQVDEEAAPAYVENYGDRTGFLIGMESGRAYLMPQPSTVIAWEVDWSDVSSILGQMPFAEDIVGAFTSITDYLGNLEEAQGTSPWELIEEGFMELDEERLMADFEAVLSELQPPAMKKFTREGFVPVEGL